MTGLYALMIITDMFSSQTLGGWQDGPICTKMVYQSVHQRSKLYQT